MPKLVGRDCGYDAAGKPRRVIVFEKDGQLWLALNSKRHIMKIGSVKLNPRQERFLVSEM
jgi:hypothetical protein